MPAPLSKHALLDRIKEAVYASGWNLLYEADPSIHPFRLRIFKEDTSLSILVYIWSLTHGGGAARPAHEYRIQMTGVKFPLSISRDYKTLLLGWHERLGVFAGFDIQRHRLSRSRSPSVQIYLETLENARQRRFAFQRKGNDELAVAFLPDLFADYAMEQEVLHQLAGDVKTLEVLEIATTEERVPEHLLQALPAERQIVIRTVAIRRRAGDFHDRVLSAYEHHCAVCDLQLDLLEAAHIIPVGSPGSNDNTSNGMALCVLHHKAYDRGLVGVDEKYQVLLNDEVITRLRRDGKVHGLDEFRKALRPEIRLPVSIVNRPRPEYLRRGMELRKWARR
jgi:putative restriction endonuclease